jgi:recombination protein RecT
MTGPQTITTAVAKRDDTPSGLVKQYSESFTAVLPSHVKPEQWVRLAQGALKKGKRVARPGGGSCTELELAAGNNPGVFLASLLESARLGLEPGTEQYYLTPRKVKGKLEILGIVGYQGYIELMYRAGAISSVVAEPVFAADKFQYRPGMDERPQHEIDWDAEDRGRLRLVYAYAVMKDGATSKVVVLNRAAIEKIKASSQGANSEYSPWVKHETAMWLKSAVRQLAKWVPTSAEYMREQLRAAREVAAEPAPGAAPAGFAPVVEGDAAPVDITEHWADEDADGADYLDAEVVE